MKRYREGGPGSSDQAGSVWTRLTFMLPLFLRTSLQVYKVDAQRFMCS